MEIGEKYLPIGTIVLLKGGSKELMITGYCILPTGKTYEHGKEVDSKGKVFDYGACTYPEGILYCDQIYGFNHDQIQKVCHMGYETDAHKEFTQLIADSLEEIKNNVRETKNEEEA